MIDQSPHSKTSQKKRKVVGLLAAFALVALIPITMVATQSEKTVQSNAQTQKPNIPDVAAERASEMITSKNQILVKFKPSATSTKKAAILSKHSLKEKDEIKQIGVKILTVPPSKTPDDVVNMLRKEDSTSIEFAEVDGSVQALMVPNDPEYSSQWHHPIMNNASAWDNANGSGITVAVADSGVEPTHPDLAPNLVPGWNLYNNNNDTRDIQSHGTAVAGAAAAVGNNASGVAGVAWNAKIMPIRIAYLGTDGKVYASFSTMAQSITYAADHGAKMVNISYGAAGWCAEMNSSIMNAAKYLYDKGGLTFFAAGNNAADTGCQTNSSYIITSSATNSSDTNASFTSFGKNVDVASPGQSILLTATGGASRYGSGTSYASPITMGLFALLWQINPSLTPFQVQSIVFETAMDKGAAGWDPMYGMGRINAGAAAERALGQPTPSSSPTIQISPTVTSTPTNAPTPTSGNDNTPPTVSITNPTNGSLISTKSTLGITAQAADDVKVAKVEFYVNNSLRCTDTTAPYSCNYKVNPKAASYTIKATAYDAANNAASSSVAVTSR